MDKANFSETSNSRETHDFMNVDSFSQLPFIRPSPLKEKPIKLFGIEFGSPEAASAVAPPAEDSESANDSTGGKGSSNNTDNNNNNNNNNGETNRRFECHYCCRNFPTSQALGGHQNAHKRERQHAKRAHLHMSEAQVYSFVNYNRSFTSPTSTLTPPFSSSSTSYNNNNSGARFYGSPYSHHHHHHPTINGSPLAMWRIPTLQTTSNNVINPTFNRDRSLNPLPSFAAGEDIIGNNNMRASSLQLASQSASPLQNRLYVHDSKPRVSVHSQDHVSLDLHL